MYPVHANTAPAKPYTTIADNSCYALEYDPVSNRIHFRVNGFWKSLEAVPGYLRDWKKVLLLVRPHFTLLTDLSDMITHPQEVGHLHVEVQRLAQQAGLSAAAGVLPSDKIASLQVTAIEHRSGMSLRAFATLAEASTYLDEATAFSQQA